MIYISAGHRGPGTGATGYIDEGAETIRLRNMIIERLMDISTGNANLPVENAPTLDAAIHADEDRAALNNVIRDVNRWCINPETDYAVELHFNSYRTNTARGVEALVSDRAGSRARRIADALAANVAAVLCIPNRGVRSETQSRRGRLGFVSDTRCPAVILEVCFASNRQDSEAYLAHREQLADRLADVLRALSSAR